MTGKFCNVFPILNGRFIRIVSRTQIVDVGFDGYAVSAGAGKYFIREISTSQGHPGHPEHPGRPIQSLMT